MTEKPTADMTREELTAEVERLRAAVAEMRDDVELLGRLEAAGVDNWEGYALAFE